jgi:DNA polymerase-1
MPIVNVDVKGLETNVAAFLSQDKKMMEEIITKKDMHEENRLALGLPSRLIAKVFIFRLIYGGSAYSYSVDPDFKDVKYSEKKWQEVIDKFYKKYYGLAAWHTKIIQEVTLNGRLVMPTGRIFTYESKLNFRNEMVWPQTTIKNYPVQGTGADIVAIARVDFARRFWRANIPGCLVSTVHDSIVLDCPPSSVEQIKDMFSEVFKDLPKNFEKIFKVEYNLPIFYELTVGPNMKDLE